MKILKVLVSGLLAGSFIGFGAVLFVVSKAYFDNIILGSFLFSIGLLLICMMGLLLYTGQIGFLFSKENKKAFVIELVLMLIGNILGALLVGLIVRVCLNLDGNTTLNETISIIANTKLLNFSGSGRNIITLIIYSLLCGMFVYLAVSLFKKEQHAILKVLGLVVSIATLVALGFEHCIAVVCYFALDIDILINPLAYLTFVITLIGNSIGAIAVHHTLEFINKVSISSKKK
jgi:formate/nitrite transporter FocA (FNT family)